MAKYKLIKEYPNSPELGFITDETMYFPASYPEFWQRVGEPVFTTNDGIDIFIGDTYWFMNDNVVYKQICHCTGLTNKAIRFSTEKLANEYLNLNQPKYSMQDILNASVNEILKWKLEIVKPLKLIDLSKLKHD